MPRASWTDVVPTELPQDFCMYKCSLAKTSKQSCVIYHIVSSVHVRKNLEAHSSMYLDIEPFNPGLAFILSGIKAEQQKKVALDKLILLLHCIQWWHRLRLWSVSEVMEHFCTGSKAALNALAPYSMSGHLPLLSNGVAFRKLHE